MEYQRKRTVFRLPKVVLVVCVVMCILFVFGLFREMMNRHEIDKQAKSLSQQISELQNQNKELGGMINSLQGNEFIEKEARLKLGLQKPGEKVALIKRDQPLASTSLALLDGDSVSGSLLISNNQNTTANPIKWWHYFFK